MKRNNATIEFICIIIAFILCMEANAMQAQGTLDTPKGYIIMGVGIILGTKALLMRYKRKPLKKED